MIAKVASLVALLATFVISARAGAQPAAGEHQQAQPAEGSGAQEAPTDAPPPSEDDLLRAAGLRPISHDRVEALVSAGTHSTRDARVRATERHGGLGLEVTGRATESDPRERRGATARIEHEHGDSHAHAFGSYDRIADGTQRQITAVHTVRYGGGWQRGRLETRVFGDSQQLHEERPASPREWTIPTSTQGATASLRSGRLVLGGIDQELVVGADYTRTTGSTAEEPSHDLSPSMSIVVRKRHADHRFFDAFLKDTLHVIESLDVSGGFVFEGWKNLGAIETIRYGTDEAMDLHFPQMQDMQVSPRVGALYRVSDELALRAHGYRRMRTPTLLELYQPIQLGSELTAANALLRPESIWGGELGPDLAAGPIEARAVAFWNEIDSPITSIAGADGGRTRMNLGHARVTGIETEASFRPAKPWLATVSYTFASSTVTDPGTGSADVVGKRLAQAPRQQAAAMLTYDDPRRITVTGAVRYIDRQYVDAANTQSLGAYTLVDAIAARTLTRGLAGFVTVENLLDRRYLGQLGLDTPGAPRTVQLGIRIDSARF